MVEPKTKAGIRSILISGWLVAELKAHKERMGGTGLVFPNRAGQGSPLHSLDEASQQDPKNVATALCFRAHGLHKFRPHR